MIRDVEKEDFWQIYELGTELHSNFKNTYDLEDLITKDYFHILVFIEKQKIIGFLIYTDLQETVDIMDIIVAEEYRNQKIASNLLDRMISRATPDTEFYLEVAVDNIPAIHLYEKFGFETIHTRKKYYGEKDAYVMERRIEHE
jgi:ribosomal-protein-alanine N-acetyltransferase